MHRAPGNCVVGVSGVLPRIRQLAVPGPLMGLPGAGSPVDGTTRRILPLSRLRSWAASFGLESPRGSVPASPTEMYKKPSPPISRSPPLWLPAFDEMLSTRTTSLFGSIVSPVIVKRLTRLTQPPGAPGLGRVKYRYMNPLTLKSGSTATPSRPRSPPLQGDKLIVKAGAGSRTSAANQSHRAGLHQHHNRSVRKAGNPRSTGPGVATSTSLNPGGTTVPAVDLRRCDVDHRHDDRRDQQGNCCALSHIEPLQLMPDHEGNTLVSVAGFRRCLASNVMSALFDLTGKKALVTGGGRGLGRAIAVGLAEHGADVAVTSRTIAELDETAAAVRATGRECLVVPGDASQKAEIDRVVGEVAAGFGRIDILINNAGVDAAAPAIDYTEADFDFVLDVNLKAYFFFAQAAAKVMMVGGGGAIASNSSIAGDVAIKNISAYNISKGGVNMMTRSLALEWAPYGIRVNAFSPAYMEVFMPGAAGEHDEAKEQSVRDLTPLGRRGRPEELVGPVVFLVSDASSYVTGEVLMVDGGWT